MIAAVRIGDRRIGRGEPTFIVAEVGINHNGDRDLALRMVDVAAASGAEAVKFQVFTADEFVNDPSLTYEYTSQDRTVRESMLEMFRRLELRDSDVSRLFSRAHDRGLIALATPTDSHAVDLLDRLAG